ncbi:MAG: glutamyl-tRNA reductase [Deferribacteraceae bacterium]|jgi:glutamyl-tRNA reductase|nr:glutamyl-tRNA reductase [Deferribacteraceae bacterium]
MQLAVLGLNHNSAPVAVREKMSAAPDKIAEIYGKFLSYKKVSEAVILSTCNRIEYYLVTKDNLDTADILYMVAINCEVGAAVLRKHSYTYCGSDAVRHLITVASGIDSLVLGEPQIFGQVKDALRGARNNGAVKSYLNRLEQFVLNITKKVRTDTGISENAVSVSYAAVDLAKKIFGTLEGHRALIIGAGEMCELAAEHLTGAGIGHITVTNRTYIRAKELARKFYGDAVEFADFPAMLHEADIIISSTGAPTAVVTPEMAAAAMKKRKRSPMFFIDIAVPRDIDSAVGDIENVYVYDIDDLKQVVEANRRERENRAVQAKEMIDGAVIRFEKRIESLSATPLVVKLRSKADSALKEELKRYCRKNKISNPEEAERLAQMTKSAVNKMMHTPTRNLKDFAGDGKKYTLAEAAALLFDIK